MTAQSPRFVYSAFTGSESSKNLNPNRNPKPLQNGSYTLLTFIHIMAVSFLQPPKGYVLPLAISPAGLDRHCAVL